MIEKIVINPTIIKKMIGRDNIAKLYITYNPKSRQAFYRTDSRTRRIPIDFNRLIDLSIYVG